MREPFLVPLLCVSLCGVGCTFTSPTGPTAGPRPPIASAPAPAPLYAEPNTQIDVGHVVNSRSLAEDPLCREPLWPCKYFRVTVPNDGVLEVLMTAEGNFDVSVLDPRGGDWWDDMGLGPGRPVRARAQARAGETYEICVWEYDGPGFNFEVRTSLLQP